MAVKWIITCKDRNLRFSASLVVLMPYFQASSSKRPRQMQQSEYGSGHPSRTIWIVDGRTWISIQRPETINSNKIWMLHLWETKSWTQEMHFTWRYYLLENCLASNYLQHWYFLISLTEEKKTKIRLLYSCFCNWENLQIKSLLLWKPKKTLNLKALCE